MSDLNVLYESDDENLMGYFCDDNEIENSHQNVHIVDYSINDSNSSIVSIFTDFGNRSVMIKNFGNLKIPESVFDYN